MDNQSKKLSIIIPLYNAEKYIQHTIENVRDTNKEDFSNYEIVLVDDGSKDNTKNIAKEICRQNENIYYYYKTNGGIASARRHGLSYATGDYITFIDQDDHVRAPYKAFLETCEKEVCDIMVSAPYHQVLGKAETKAKVLFQEGTYKDNQIRGIACNVLTKGMICLEDNHNMIPNSIWNCLFKRELVLKNDIQFYSFLKYEDDWLFLLDCLAKANTICLSEDGWYVWMINPISESHTDKYLENFYEKKQNAIQYKLDYLKELQVSQKQIHWFYERELRKRIVMYGLYNACMNEEKSFVRAYKEAKAIYKKEMQKGKLGRFSLDGPKEKIIGMLVELRLIWLAVFVNYYFVKKRYSI